MPDVATLLDLEREFFTLYFDGLAATRDDCFGVRARALGRATAYSAKGIPYIAYNRIAGMVEGQEQLADLCGDYPEKSGFGVDVTPGVTSRAMLDVLAREGFAARAFLNTHCGPPGGGAAPGVEGVNVRQLEAADRELFAEVFLQCGLIPPLADGLSQADLANAEASLLSYAGCAGFVAEVDGRAAAVARVFFSETGAAFLPGAFCIPELRRRGCQTALLSARLELAAERAAPFVAGQAQPETTSARNLERAGLALRSTKLVVARPPAAPAT